MMVIPGADDMGNLERREGIFGWAYRIRLNNKVSLTSTISQFCNKNLRCSPTKQTYRPYNNP